MSVDVDRLTGDAGDVVKATAALAHRAGALQFQINYSNVAPSTQWFATATFPDPFGATSDPEDERCPKKQGSGSTPVVACNHLAEQLLDGSVCRRCNHVISVSGDDPTRCQWRRVGDVWAPGCGLPVDREIKVVPRAL